MNQKLDIYRSEYILKLETELEELKKDVKRFIELQSKVYKLYNSTENEANDLVGLLNKLSKVGVSND